MKKQLKGQKYFLITYRGNSFGQDKHRLSIINSLIINDVNIKFYLERKIL